MAGEIQTSAGSISGPWPLPSIADLERDEEIRQLRALVTKLSEEVNRLGDMISDMG